MPLNCGWYFVKIFCRTGDFNFLPRAIWPYGLYSQKDKGNWNTESDRCVGSQPGGNALQGPAQAGIGSDSNCCSNILVDNEPMVKRFAYRIPIGIGVF